MKAAVKIHNKALLIHRRDLRVQDNTALNRAFVESKAVLSCFIFDPVQVGGENEYRSERQITFMHQSLSDLEGQYKKIEGRLHLFSGRPAEIVEALITSADIDAVYVNADYTPYARKRDALLEDTCKKHGISFTACHDLLLSGDPEATRTGTGKPYTVFTPYWRRAARIEVSKPVRAKSGLSVTKNVTDLPYAVLDRALQPLEIPGGRVQARVILKDIKDFKAYAKEHNDPTKETTRLSAHNKFGTVSVREVYYAMGKALGYGHPLIRQMYWRDFYMSIVHFFPHVIGNSFAPQHEILYDAYNEVAVKAWKDGKTGVPIVDAGMRELNQTGYMHNRVRLITGSFLTKDLHQAWWIGEQYFAQQLIDYDLSVNNGNWQWVGGTGVDPVPYFRVFNPWLQAKKFDPEALYIKRWIPELKDVSARDIHRIATHPLSNAIAYPAPIVDHQQEMRKVRELYAKKQSK